MVCSKNYLKKPTEEDWGKYHHWNERKKNKKKGNKSAKYSLLTINLHTDYLVINFQMPRPLYFSSPRPGSMQKNNHF